MKLTNLHIAIINSILLRIYTHSDEQIRVTQPLYGFLDARNCTQSDLWKQKSKLIEIKKKKKRKVEEYRSDLLPRSNCQLNKK